MTRLRLAKYKELKKVAESVGFGWLGCEGSQNTFHSTEGRIIVIPDHGSQVIVRSLLRKIIRDLGISVAGYHKILDDI